MKNPLRKIVVGGQVYFWRLQHHHSGSGPSRCSEKLTLYLQGHKKSPLRLLFKEKAGLDSEQDKKWQVGHPESGVIFCSQVKAEQTRLLFYINLNRPAVIRGIIDHYASKTWHPKETQSPLFIEDALQALEKIHFLQKLQSPPGIKEASK